ncbi:ATP-binding protein [Kribbella sp. NPDC049584]|uniref:ATP-binding protein n=1 Tax=Kribbella sp. NPDC049584 TaxID=3154833 RepID=UPI003442A49C
MAHGSPFTPRPGVAPRAPLGREAERALARAFASDVAHAQVETNGLLFSGSRGMGKSTLLLQVAEELRSRGWRVAEVKVGAGQPVNEALQSSLDSERMRGGARVLDRLRSLSRSVRGGSLSVGVGGPSASVNIERPTGGPQIAKLLTDAGEQARRSGQPAMVVIDNLQRWSPSQLEQLCDGLNECSRAGHPVGVVTAGSGAAEAALTTADRGQVFDVGRIDVLTPPEANAVVRHTASLAGVTFSQDALNTVVQFSQGHPLRLQLAAFEAWRAAPNGTREITNHSALAGVERARHKLDRQIHGPAWNRLQSTEQAIAQTLAAGPPIQDRASVEARLPPSSRSANVDAAFYSLIRKDVIKEIRKGGLAFTDPGTSEWILRFRPPAGSANHVLQASPSPRQIGSTKPAIAPQASRPGRGPSPNSPTHER